MAVCRTNVSKEKKRRHDPKKKKKKKKKMRKNDNVWHVTMVNVRE
jgi:hypothetical protein